MSKLPEYSCVTGEAVSLDDGGLWLRKIDGVEMYARFQSPGQQVRVGHRVTAAGMTAKDGSFEALLLANESTGERWKTYTVHNRSWAGAVRQLFGGEKFFVAVGMFIPLVNLFVGTAAGLAAVLVAMKSGTFFRTLGVFLLCMIGSAMVLFPLGLAFIGSGKQGLEAGLLMWYLVSFPLSYLVVFGSFVRNNDELQRQVDEKLEQVVARSVRKQPA